MFDFNQRQQQPRQQPGMGIMGRMAPVSMPQRPGLPQRQPQAMNPMQRAQQMVNALRGVR